MPQIRLLPFVATLLLLHYVGAQQNCINTCTDSANVLTQLKTCSGCGTDDWACFCRCPQYINALVSCADQYCTGSDVTNSIVSFCANQGVTLSYSSTATSPSTSASGSATSGTTAGAASGATSGTAAGAVSSAISSAISNAISSTTTGSSQTSLTATDASDLSAYLASAVPASARTESSSACFVNTPYSYYSTPTWYSSLPTQAQSYYSSVNQGNTAACTLTPAQAAALGNTHSGRSGLSGGAIAGIVIGALLAALLLAALLWCCLRRRRRARRDRAAYANEKSGMVEPRSSAYGQSRSQAPYLNAKEGMNGTYANGNPASGNLANGGFANRNHTNGGFANESLANGTAAPGSNHMGPVVGGAGFGAHSDQETSPTHFTSTTTRTTIRSRPRKPANVAPSNQPTRPPPQPISNFPNAVDSNNNNYSPPQSMPQQPAGRRVF